VVPDDGYDRNVDRRKDVDGHGHDGYDAQGGDQQGQDHERVRPPQGQPDDPHTLPCPLVLPRHFQARVPTPIGETAAELAPLVAVVPPRRYAVGVIPVTRRNVVVKWLGVRNPTERAISPIGNGCAASSAAACSIRRRTRKRCGDAPVLRLKSRAKWKGLMCTSSLSSASRSSR